MILAGAAAPAAHAAKSTCARYGDSAASSLSRGEAAKAVRCLVNRRRAHHDLHRLAMDHRLDRAAQRHARYMRNHHCFAHRCKGEASLGRRLRRVHYITDDLKKYAYGENIAWGSGDLATPKAIVKAWMHSSGHRHNILNRDFRDIGVGFVHGTLSNANADAAVYTTDFGLRGK